MQLLLFIFKALLQQKIQKPNLRKSCFVIINNCKKCWWLLWECDMIFSNCHFNDQMYSLYIFLSNFASCGFQFYHIFLWRFLMILLKYFILLINTYIFILIQPNKIYWIAMIHLISYKLNWGKPVLKHISEYRDIYKTLLYIG